MAMKRAFAVCVVACLAMGAFLVVPERTSGASTLTLSRLYASGDDLVVAWSRSNDALFSSYQLYIRASADPTYGAPVLTTSDIEERVCSVSYYTDWQGHLQTIQPSSNYVVFVRDNDWLGHSDSVPQTMSTTQNTSLILSSATGVSVSLAWTNPIYYSSTQGFSTSFLSYDVYRKVGISGTYQLQAEITNGATKDWIDGAVSPGQTYYYDVMQFDIVSWTGNGTIAFYDYHITNELQVTTPSLTVVSPNGGEQWQAGTTHQISWTSTGTITSVAIKLYKSGTLDSTITSSTSNTGTYSWTVPATLAIGADYKVNLSSADGTGVSDQSDNVFSVTGGVELTSPNGGEHWIAGQINSITWSSTGGGSTYMKIDLYKGGSYLSSITPSTSNDGSFEWTVPADQAIASDYKIRIESTTYATIADDSDSGFTITGSITVTSPDGGEEWAIGSSHSVNWTSTGDGLGAVRIELYNGTSLVYVVNESAPNTGSYLWSLPDSVTAGQNYKIRISSTADGSIYNDSSSPFSITAKSSRGLAATISNNLVIVGVIAAAIVLALAGLLLAKKKKKTPSQAESKKEELPPTPPKA